MSVATLQEEHHRTPDSHSRLCIAVQVHGRNAGVAASGRAAHVAQGYASAAGLLRLEVIMWVTDFAKSTHSTMRFT